MLGSKQLHQEALKLRQKAEQRRKLSTNYMHKAADLSSKEDYTHAQIEQDQASKLNEEAQDYEQQAIGLDQRASDLEMKADELERKQSSLMKEFEHRYNDLERQKDDLRGEAFRSLQF